MAGGRTIPTCNRLILSLALLAGVVATAPLRAENKPGDLAAYARARAADAGGRAREAAAGYAVALQGDPANPLVAIRAYRAGLAAGDYALTNQARAVLEKSDTAPPDAALIALAEAVTARDTRAQAAAIDRIGGGALDFIAPSLRGWSELGTDPAAALTLVAASAGNPLARRYANENRALLMIAAGRADDGIALVQVMGGPERADPDLRIAAARLLAGQGMAARAASLLVGDDPVLLGERARIATRASNGDAAFGIGYVLTRLASDLSDGRAAKLSIALTRAALRLDPGNDRARLLLANALSAGGGIDHALAALDPIAPASPYSRAAQGARITLLDDGGQRDAAIALAATLAADRSATADDVRRHADLLMAAGSFGAAASAYQRAIALQKGEPDWVLHLLLGTMLERNGDWQRARRALQQAVALAPDQPLALNALGYALLGHGGNLAEAQRLLERANRLSPGDLAILDSLAWSYAVAGDATRALPLLERAAAGRPGDTEISEHLGDVYWQLGRRYEARYAWAAARVAAEPDVAARLVEKIANGPVGRSNR